MSDLTKEVKEYLAKELDKINFVLFGGKWFTADDIELVEAYVRRYPRQTTSYAEIARKINEGEE